MAMPTDGSDGAWAEYRRLLYAYAAALPSSDEATAFQLLERANRERLKLNAQDPANRVTDAEHYMIAFSHAAGAAARDEAKRLYGLMDAAAKRTLDEAELHNPGMIKLWTTGSR